MKMLLRGLSKMMLCICRGCQKPIRTALLFCHFKGKVTVEASKTLLNVSTAE